MTDHGAFVLINVYVPNAGPAPERPRAAFKCRFLQALHSKAVQLRDAGRQASFGMSSCQFAAMCCCKSDAVMLLNSLP